MLITKVYTQGRPSSASLEGHVFQLTKAPHYYYCHPREPQQAPAEDESSDVDTNAVEPARDPVGEQFCNLLYTPSADEEQFLAIRQAFVHVTVSKAARRRTLAGA